MRKTNKLLAFAIVFAMVVSTMVMPVSANTATENLYAAGSFESFTTTDEVNDLLAGEGAGNHTYTLMTDGGANSTANYVMVSDRGWVGSTFATNGTNVVEGKAYKMTMYLKSVSGTISVTPQVAYTGGGQTISGTAVSVSDSAWTEATVIFTAKAEYVGSYGQSVAFKAYEGTKASFYVDEVSLVEYIEPITNVFGDGTFESLTSDTYGTLMNAAATDPTITFVDGADNNCVAIGAGSYQSASANTQWISGVLETGATYIATADVKLQNAGTANTMFVKYRDTVNNTLVQGATVSGVTADAWKTVSVTFTATSANMQLQFFCYDKLPYYLDNVSVKKVVANNPAWGTFEYAGDFANVSGSGATPTLATDGNGAFNSDNYVKVTGRSYQGANIIANMPLEEGKAYKLSGYVRLADGAADTQVTPEANYSGNGTIFRGTPVTAKAGVWTKFEVELAPNEIFRGKWEGHTLNLKAVAPANVDLWYDNFTLEEIAIPALTMTEDFEVAEAVAIDSVQTITVDFSHDAYNFSGKDDPTNAGNASDQAWSNLAASNFAVDNGATLAVDVVNNKQAVLTISDFAYGTTYTVTATGLTDYFGNTITDATVATFTTEEEPVVVVPDNLAEGKVPRGSACDVTDNGDGTYTVANQTWGSSYKAFIDGITVETGKKYLAVAYVKSAAGTAENDAAILVGGVPQADASRFSFSMKCNSEVIGDDWTKVSGVVEVTANDGSETASINIGVHGGTASGVELFVVKGFELRVFGDGALDIDTNCLYKVVDNSLYLHNPSMIGQTIYVYAVNVADDGSFESATMLTDWFNQSGVGSYELPEADKYFIWDAGMKPLTTPLTLN